MRDTAKHIIGRREVLLGSQALAMTSAAVYSIKTERVSAQPLDVSQFSIGGSGTDQSRLELAMSAAGRRGVPVQVSNMTLDDDLHVPNMAKLLFAGELKALGSHWVHVDSSLVTIKNLRLLGGGLKVGPNARDLTVSGCRISAKGIQAVYLQTDVKGGACRCSFEDLTLESDLIGLHQENASDCTFTNLMVSNSPRGIIINSGARNRLSGVHVGGRPIAAIKCLAARHVARALPLWMNEFSDIAVASFEEEGVSFDCRGDSPKGMSSVCIAKAISARDEELTIRLGPGEVYEPYTGYTCVVRSGELSGRAFPIMMSRFGGLLCHLTLGAGWAEAGGRISPGDQISIEIACGENTFSRIHIAGGFGSRSGDGRRGSALDIYGWGRDTLVQEVEIEDGNLTVTGVSGLGPTGRVGVPDHVTVHDARLQHGLIDLRPKCFGQAVRMVPVGTVLDKDAQRVLA